MKSHFGIRLWILITAIVLVAGGTIYGLSTAWRRMHLLETKLNSSHIASFRIAGEVQHGLLNLNNAMLRYVLVRDPRQWQEFDLASTDFDHWTDAHDPSLNPDSPLTTDAERKVFTALNRAFDAYLSSARAVQSNAQPAMVSSAQLAQLSAFDTQTHRIGGFTGT